MNFELTEEHLAVRDAARDFAQNVCKPGVIERDEHSKFPEEQVKKMAELGFLGVVVYTRVHTPRFCGQALKAGAFDFVSKP